MHREGARRLAVAIVLGVCSACFLAGGGLSKSLENPDDGPKTLVLGHLDTRSLSIAVDFVELRRVRPVTDEPFHMMRWHQGVFYKESLPEGSYTLHQFGQHDESHYQLSRQGSPVQLNIDASGIYYVGAFRYVPVEEGGMFSTGSFELERVDHPGEAIALKTVLPHAEGTIWEDRIRHRLQSLR